MEELKPILNSELQKNLEASEKKSQIGYVVFYL
jgi:hypothetical protein